MKVMKGERLKDIVQQKKVREVGIVLSSGRKEIVVRRQAMCST